VRVFCLGGLPPYSIAEYPKIDSDKTADEESCDMESIGGAVWRPKLEPRQKLKQWLEVYHGYHAYQSKQCNSFYCGHHDKSVDR
jgi:hypothetical protein